MQNRFNIRSKKFLCWLVFMAILVVLLLFVVFLSLDTPEFSKNRQRRVDLASIQANIIVDSIFKEKNILKALPVGCSDVGILGDAITGDTHNNKYAIGISTDKGEFVLRTKMDDESYLTNMSKNYEDLDGDVFGCDCNAPYYCFKTDLISHLNNKQ